MKEDDLTRLINATRRTTLAPAEEFDLMSSAQRKSNLDYLYEITTDALKGANPRAETDLMHIASSRDPASGVARQIHNNFVLLFEMYHTDDPAEFGRQVQVYFDRVMEKVARLLEDGPDNFKKVTVHVKETVHGPNGYIYRMFGRKFGTLLREGDSAAGAVKHDVSRIEDIKLFENEAGLRKVWTAERIRELSEMRTLSQASFRVRARAFRTSLQHVLSGAMTEVGVEVDIDRYLRYREGLELSEVDLVLHELIHNGIKYHILNNGSDRYVRIRWDGKRYALVVEDNGRGIHRIDKVFEFGYREADRNPGIPGTGTGLAAVKDRIEKLGWKIELESEPEKGSSFIIHPKPGDVYSDDSPDTGGAQTEGGGGMASKSDISYFTSAHVVEGLMPSGEAGAHLLTDFRFMPAVVMRRSVFAAPVRTAGSLSNIAAATFIRAV